MPAASGTCMLFLVKLIRLDGPLIDSLLKFGAATNVVNYQGLLPFQAAPLSAQSQLAIWMNSMLAFHISGAWAKHEPSFSAQRRSDIRRSFERSDFSRFIVYVVYVCFFVEARDNDLTNFHYHQIKIRFWT
jgi:hypothetical protein